MSEATGLPTVPKLLPIRATMLNKWYSKLPTLAVFMAQRVDESLLSILASTNLLFCKSCSLQKLPSELFNYRAHFHLSFLNLLNGSRTENKRKKPEILFNGAHVFIIQSLLPHRWWVVAIRNLFDVCFNWDQVKPQKDIFCPKSWCSIRPNDYE